MRGCQQGDNCQQVTTFRVGAIALVALALASCNSPKDGADAQTRPAGGQAQVTAVDVAIAASAPLESIREYTGTTQPVREVAIRAQAEGQLRVLNVDVGDRVKQGQILAQIDDSLLDAQTAEAQAELASRRTEINQLQSQVSDAQTQVVAQQQRRKSYTVVTSPISGVVSTRSTDRGNIILLN